MIKYQLNSLYKNTFYIVLSSIISLASGFFFWIFAARLYTIEDMGRATALISSLGIIILLSRLGFDISIIRYFPLYEKVKLIGTSLTITTLATLVVSVIYAITVALFLSQLSFIQRSDYMIIFILVSIANSIVNITSNALVASRDSLHYFYINIIMILRIPFLYLLTSVGCFGIYISFGLANGIAAVYALLFLSLNSNSIKIRLDKDFISDSLSYSSANYVSSILGTAPNFILPIIVLGLLGEAEAAKYFIAFSISNLFQIVPGAFSQSLMVEGSHGESLTKNTIRAIIMMFVVLIPMVIITCIFGDRILGLLRTEYIEAFGLLRILAVSSFLVAIYSLFTPIQNVRMRVESIMKLNAARFILLLGLSYIFISKFGIIGTGYAWIITYLIIVSWIAKVARTEWVHFSTLSRKDIFSRKVYQKIFKR